MRHRYESQSILFDQIAWPTRPISAMVVCKVVFLTGFYWMYMASASGDRVARRNVLVLATAQALAGANASVIFATGAILGNMLAPSPVLATLPISLFMVGMASGALPAGWVARRHGRRAAFVIGCLAGTACGLMAALAVYIASFPLLGVATYFGGIYAGISQSYRFAAADTASEAFRPHAIAWVMAGGVMAGVLGPQLVQATMDVWPPYLFIATYLAQAGVALLAMAVVWQVRMPRPKPADTAGARPLAEIVRQPRFIAAAICGTASYVLMNLVMTSAPLAMKICGLTLRDSNIAIQWHVVAMFAPSFFTGGLVARFGAERVVAAGLTLTTAAALVGLSGITAWHFWICLILLGFGWNLGYIGASAMVLATHRPSERNKAQACNDFLIFGFTALGSLASGQILVRHGWDMINIVTFPVIAISSGVLIFTIAATRAAARRSPSPA